MACSSDSARVFLRRLAALFESISLEPAPHEASTNLAMFVAMQKPPARRTSVLAGMSFVLG